MDFKKRINLRDIVISISLLLIIVFVTYWVMIVAINNYSQFKQDYKVLIDAN